MNEDFTEAEDFDELPEGVEFAKPAPKRNPQPQQPQVQPRRRQQAQPQQQPRMANPPAAEEPKSIRYTPYLMPKRVGVIDNETGMPLMEDEKVNSLLLGLVTKLLNDLEEIKQNL